MTKVFCACLLTRPAWKKKQTILQKLFPFLKLGWPASLLTRLTYCSDDTTSWGTTTFLTGMPSDTARARSFLKCGIAYPNWSRTGIKARFLKLPFLLPISTGILEQNWGIRFTCLNLFPMTSLGSIDKPTFGTHEDVAQHFTKFPRLACYGN